MAPDQQLRRTASAAATTSSRRFSDSSTSSSSSSALFSTAMECFSPLRRLRSTPTALPEEGGGGMRRGSTPSAKSEESGFTSSSEKQGGAGRRVSRGGSVRRAEVYWCEHDGINDKVSTYVAWVNNQLTRGAHTQPISNLERGISDGVTLPQLLHILGEEPVPDVVVPPKTEAQRKQNIRLCFQYLQQRHIHPRNSTAPDVSSGNLKCIMRLLLALAANFKTYRSDANSKSLRYGLSGSDLMNQAPTAGGGGGGGKNEPPNNPDQGGEGGENIGWVHDQVTETRKQLESLKQLLLQDITEEEKVLLEEAGVEIAVAPSCTSCPELGNRLRALEETLKQRDQQIMELKAEVLHFTTRDKYLTSELEERGRQLAKAKTLHDKKQIVVDKSRSHHTNSFHRPQQLGPTKILYYFGSSTTPYLSQTTKRLGEITLRDFKSVVNRSGKFRYDFKCHDPEFGTVKEEVVEEGAVLPGWDGKIVGFVEEQSSSLDHIEI